MAEFIINDYMGVYKRAVELYEEGKFQDSIPLFTEVVANDKNNYIACYYLGDCYYFGRGVEKNHTRAFELFMKAATNKITEACYMVGLCYLNGEGIAQNLIQSVAWFTEAAKYGHTYSQYYLGVAYMKGLGVNRDIPRAAQWLVHAAKEGIVEAQRDAAICYEALSKFKGAATLYLAGAENGDSYCQEHIADCYLEGRGTLKSTVLALHYYEMAASQGNVSAQYKLAMRYYLGDGVPKSLSNAIIWWTKAANAGNNDARVKLGECYFSGNGVYKNIDTAILWWTKAAEDGCVEAMYKLAQFHHDPKSKEYTLDDELSKFWWMKAAQTGDSYAMLKIGECFEKGIGCTTSLEESYKWYRLASNSGNEEASELCKRFSKGRRGKVILKKAKDKQ